MNNIFKKQKDEPKYHSVTFFPQESYMECDEHTDKDLDVNNVYLVVEGQGLFRRYADEDNEEKAKVRITFYPDNEGYGKSSCKGKAIANPRKDKSFFIESNIELRKDIFFYLATTLSKDTKIRMEFSGEVSIEGAHKFAVNSLRFIQVLQSANEDIWDRL